MTRFAIGTIFLVTASAAGAQSTDFGIRSVNGGRAMVEVSVHPKAAERQSDLVQTAVAHEGAATNAVWTPLRRGSGNLGLAARLGGNW